MTTTTVAKERTDLLATLTASRGFLRGTLRGLTDEQAGLHPTVSELCLGGLIKHVSATEWQWAEFILQGASAMQGENADQAEWAASFRWQPGDTIVAVLEDYERVAGRTDGLLMSLPTLDVAHPLPPAPWFAPGEVRSARRVFLHLVAETSQHAGHADIIRESIDGAKTMG